MGTQDSRLVSKGKVRTDPENQHISVSGPSDPENWDRDEDVLILGPHRGYGH